MTDLFVARISNMAELLSTSLITSANLKAYYRVEPGALTTDSGTGSQTLTNNNTVGSAVGQYGGGADFGSSNTNKSLTRTNDLGITGGACSISCWVKLNAAIASSQWTLVSQQDAGTFTRNDIQYDYNSGTPRLKYFRVKNNVAAQGPTYTVTLPTTKFVHIVYTYDATNVRGYYNGVLVGGPTAASGNGATNGADIIVIGAGHSGTALGEYASAVIDDIAYFNTAISAAQVWELYQTQSAGLLNLL